MVLRSYNIDKRHQNPFLPSPFPLPTLPYSPSIYTSTPPSSPHHPPSTSSSVPRSPTAVNHPHPHPHPPHSYTPPPPQPPPPPHQRQNHAILRRRNFSIPGHGSGWCCWDGFGWVMDWSLSQILLWCNDVNGRDADVLGRRGC